MLQELGRVCAPVNTQVINETEEVTRPCVTSDDVSGQTKEQKHHMATDRLPLLFTTTNKHRKLLSYVPSTLL